jgi:hypothetical protein
MSECKHSIGVFTRDGKECARCGVAWRIALKEKRQKLLIDWEKVRESTFKVSIAQSVTASPVILKNFCETHLTKHRSIV